MQRLICQQLHVAAIVPPGFVQRPADAALDSAPVAMALFCNDHIDFFLNGMDAARLLDHKSDRADQVCGADAGPSQAEGLKHFVDAVLEFHMGFLLMMFVSGCISGD